MNEPSTPDEAALTREGLTREAGSDGGARQRLHPATLLLRAPQAVRMLVNALPLFAILYAKGNTLLLFGAAGVVVLLGWLWIFFYWLRFSYRIGTEEISIDSGIMSRTHRVIPFDRVQDVSIEQGLLARITGLAKVRLETGAGSGGGEEEGELNAIALGDAEALRDRIRTWRAGHHITAPAAPDAGEIAGEEAVDRPVFAMSLGRVLTAGLFNFSLALFAAIFGLLQLFGDVLPFDPFRPLDWEQAFDENNPVILYLLAHQYLSVLVGIAFVTLVGIASGVVTTLLKQYGFTLTRTPTGLRRQRGLTTRTDVVIPIKRVQAAMLVTGWLRRRFGWYGLKLQSLASDGAKESDHDVAPLAHLDEIDRILAETGADRKFARSAPDAQGWRGVHPAMWRYGAIGVVPLIMLLLVAAPLVARLRPDLPFPVSLWLIAPLCLFYMVARYWRWSHHRYRLELAGTIPVKLEITHGWWKRRQLILPVRHIQSVDIDYGPLYRLAGLANIRLGVAGQSGLSAYRIGALPLATAYALRAKLIG